MIQANKIVSTTCPYYKVTSPFDSPVNHGNLCVKGRFGYDFIYSPQRVTTIDVSKV